MCRDDPPGSQERVLTVRAAGYSHVTTTMTGMKDVVDLVRTRGLHGRVRTIVGGAPLSAEFAREIGADAYAFDAATAVERVAALVEAAVATV